MVIRRMWLTLVVAGVWKIAQERCRIREHDRLVLDDSKPANKVLVVEVTFHILSTKYPSSR